MIGMKSEKQIGGVTADHGTVMRVETRVTSESTAAMQEALAVYDSYYLGAHLRPERIAVSSARAMFGLASLENRVPEVALHWQAACNAFKPREALLELDAVLEEIGGTYTAPAMRVIPCTTLFAIAYKFADTIIQSQNAWYDNRINWLSVANSDREVIVPKPLPLNSVYTATPHIKLEVPPTRPKVQRFGKPSADTRVVFFAPIAGQGAAPFSGYGDGVTFNDVMPMRWAIYFQTSDVEVVSPAKKLVMIAYLNEMFKYLDGITCHFAGRRQYSRSYRAKKSGEQVPHEIIANLLIRVLHTAVGRLEYLDAESVPGSNEMQLIRAIVNVLHLLDHPSDILDALVSTTEMRQFMRMLMVSMLVKNGEFEESSDGQQYDMNVGIVPPQAARFLFEDVAAELPAHMITEALLSILTDGRNPRILVPDRVPSFKEMVAQYGSHGSDDRNVIDILLRNSAPEQPIGAVDSLASMRADYVAAAIAARMRESMPVLVRLMRGEIPGFEHLHTDVPMVDMDVTVSILETIDLLFSRDLVGMANLLEWEEPFTGARWSTQFGAFSVTFPTYPLRYIVHDVAADIIGEVADIDKGASAAVADALKTLGISLIQCEPAITFVRLNSKDSRSFSSYLFQELEQVGSVLPPQYPAFYGNMATSHGALKVRSIYSVYSEQIWHQMELGIHANTQRNYAPQPLPASWAPWVRYSISVGEVRKLCPFFETIHASLTGRRATSFTANLFMTVYLNPAFQDIAGFMPYVQMMTQTPPEAHSFALAGRVEFNEQSVCNLEGTVIVPESPVSLSGIAPSQQWRLPTLSNGLAYTPRPMGHMTLPVLWDALR